MNNNIVRFGLAAAAIVLVVLVGIRFLPGGNVGSDPTPTPIPTPTATPASFEDHAGGGAALLPGSYFTDNASPLRITFTVPVGWSKSDIPGMVWTEDSAARVSFSLIDNVYGDGCGPNPTLLDPPVGRTVDDLTSTIASISGPGLEVTAPTDVAVAGFAGKRVDLTAPASWDTCDGGEFRLWNLPAGSDFEPLDPGGRTRIWVLDIDGTRLVISATDRPEATAAQVAQLDAIVDSLQISRP